MTTTDTAGSSTHGCPGGCGRQVPRHLYACKACWGRLPYDMQKAIRATNGRDLAAHGQAMAAARQWFERHIGVRT